MLARALLSKQDLDKLNSFNDNFHRAGTSTTVLTMVVVRGQIAGGVATLWHKRLDSVINLIKFEVDWCFALWIKCNNKE